MNILKKQGVAWIIAVVMIVIGISVGSARANIIANPNPGIGDDTLGDPDFSFVFDDANVLSADEEAILGKLNAELYDNYGVVVACVTTDYGLGDLFDFALDYAEDIGLGGCDFIVVLDISGENYWLVQGNDLYESGAFTDEDCSDYAWAYMEDDFARGDYGSALISLVKALSDWNSDFWG